MRALQATLALAGVGAAIAPGALATPDQDFQAVLSDYNGDSNVTACRFTRTQLVNARSRITPR